MLNKHPGAQLLDTSSIPPEEIQFADAQWLQITSVSPEPDQTSPMFSNPDVPPAVKSYYEQNDIHTFSFSRPVNRAPDGRASDIASSWTEKTVCPISLAPLAFSLTLRITGLDLRRCIPNRTAAIRGGRDSHHRHLAEFVVITPGPPAAADLCLSRSRVRALERSGPEHLSRDHRATLPHPLSDGRRPIQGPDSPIDDGVERGGRPADQQGSTDLSQGVPGTRVHRQKAGPGRVGSETREGYRRSRELVVRLIGTLADLAYTGLYHRTLSQTARCAVSARHGPLPRFARAL